ncbi:zinc ribbon domain-containing protein [Dictyobacter kobayashii]|uniref:Zinc-ribbon domain-containing protein n=1 Tax=Dictyobacter kobayashii TaxID=2014872 RepID=A0A402AN48_9CHLR|nr:zinc ribbon domain-containing protein [Dictyobacter kobayashii]GCE20618.1 hypothetical protein KDK_44180 [Dictyobacter kobayashii]
MATVCTHCGTELPREDARFCNNCGTLVPDHPLSPHARMAVNNDAPVKKNDIAGSQFALPEQVAQQPSAHSKQPANPNVTPWLGIQGHDATNVTPWLGIQGYDMQSPAPTARSEAREPGKAPGPLSAAESPVADRPAAEATPEQNVPQSTPERSVDANNVPAGPSNARRLNSGSRLPRRGSAEQPSANIAWPGPLTHVMTGDDKAQVRQDVQQNEFPILPSTPPPARDLHVKIWDDADKPAAAEPSQVAREPAVSQPEPQSQSQDDEVEYLPTRPLAAASSVADEETLTETTLTHLPTAQLKSVSSPVQPAADRQAETPLSQDTPRDGHIDQLPTAQWQTPEVVREKTPSPASSPGVARNISAPGFNALSSYPPVPSVKSAPSSAPANLATPVPRNREALLQPAVPSKSKPAGMGKKRTLLIAVAAIVLICVVALGSWIALAQPFTISPATNPLQSVTNSTLGLSMEYPQGWSSSQSGTTLKIADSSNTAQVSIVMSDAGSVDPAKYLQQQANKLGLTDAKTGSATTFAGTSWQQTSGDFLLSGASYVGTIYVGTHNNHLYTWTQIAPKNVFHDEETLVFAPARSSLHLQ